MKNQKIITLFILVLTACNNSSPKEKNSGRGSLTGIIVDSSYVNLGGEEQYVEILTSSDNKPVLLFIHGGPGWPQTPQLRYFNSGLTEAYTLVIWEQRGSGKSLQKSQYPRNLTLDQIVSDGHELTKQLREKFGGKKIYLAGYSWGSIVGIMLALKYPEDYETYIGISQVINMQIGMKITREWLTKKAKERNDTATLRTLLRLQSGDTTLCNGGFDCFLKQYGLLNLYSGAVYNNTIDKDMEKALSLYPDYRNYDWQKAFDLSVKNLEKDLFTADFSTIRKLDIPVYFLQGRHDWNVPSVLAESLFNNLEAPKKEFFWFENSGHGPLEEEAGKFNDIMINKIMK
jgi:proline iminopeptidase